MKLATKRESGVTNTTTRLMPGLSSSMKNSVPRMVTMPVKAWVKPVSKPSEMRSISVVIRLRMSPWGVESIVLRGRSETTSMARMRMSRTVR